MEKVRGTPQGTGMEALFKKLTGRTAPPSPSVLWLKKQVEWYRQMATPRTGGVPRSARMHGSGKKWEKEIRQLLALDIKKKTPYQAGTKLVREYKGKRYEVLILDGDFVYNGLKYKSLSKIAEEITGTRWNGKIFFGLHLSSRTSPRGNAVATKVDCTERCLQHPVSGGNNGR